MKMMKRNNTIKLIAFALFFLGGITLSAQEGKLKKADKEYENLAYIDAAEVYLDVAQSGYKSAELFQKLGNSYYFNAQYTDALKWYGELFKLTQETEPQYYLRYSQTLKANGNDEEAKQWYDRYLQKSGILNNDLSTAKDYLAIIHNNSDRYTFQPTNINTEGIEFGNGFHGKNLLVTMSSNSKGSKQNDWDGLPYLDIFEATIKEDGTLGKPQKIAGDVNTKYHESTAVITNDGKIMYFTRNNISPRDRRGKKETQHLKIYRAHLVNGEWTQIEDLSINGDNYDTAHPALNPQGDKLYFVSNMPQTLGATDIFMVSINNDGSLGKPVNLGPKINTKGRESFPFITQNNELYFSSDGHFGLGGYDVYYVKLKGAGYEGNLLNVGKPINSSFDDFGFVIRNKKGYVSSNRAGGNGYDDLYGFTELKPIEELAQSKMFGTVIDKETQEPLANATVTLLDENNETIATVTTDRSGRYSIKPINPLLTYIVRANKDTYDGDDIFSQKNPEPREHNFELVKNVVPINTGDDIAKILNIVIYFDLDRFNIRPDAQVELEKLVALLKKNPGFKIDVRSHTDSRASDNYNKVLSNNRAKATVDYLVSRGIDRSRLTGKGYGETALVNGCSNGVGCTETQHQQNRRSEFIVSNN